MGFVSRAGERPGQGRAGHVRTWATKAPSLPDGFGTAPGRGCRPCSVLPGRHRLADGKCLEQSCWLVTLCSPRAPRTVSPNRSAGVTALRTKCQAMQMRLRERLIEGPCPAPELQSNMQMAPEEASEGY